MAETGAVFGGEHSAHYYFRDNYRADSGLIAALVVLELLCRAGRAAVGAARARSSATPTRARSTPRSPIPHAVIERGRRRATPTPTQDRLDGLTVDLGDWWFNLRPSNTEPLLRLNLEAPDARRRATTHVAEVLAPHRPSD